MANHRLVRTILGFLWFASAVVVLGISALGANNDRKINAYRPVIALNLATSALTILYELIWLPGRFILRGTLVSLMTEATITFILWILWLATAAAYTAKTKYNRDVCNNLDAIPEVIIVARDLRKTCRTYKTNLAFVWIAFALSTIIFLYTVYTAMTRRTGAVTGARSKWAASFGDASAGVTPVGTGSATAEPKVTPVAAQSTATAV